MQIPVFCNPDQHDQLASPQAHHCGLLVLVKKRPSLEARMNRWRYPSALPHSRYEARVVECFYVNPVTETFSMVDRRVVDSGVGRRVEVANVVSMLQGAIRHDGLPFTTVLMDSWCATRELMSMLDQLDKAYWCRVKDTCMAMSSRGYQPYQEIRTLQFDREASMRGKLVVPKGFPPDYRVRLFKVGESTGETKYVVTNQLGQDDADAAHLMCNFIDTGRRLKE